jgi:hypothetical protein
MGVSRTARTAHPSTCHTLYPPPRIPLGPQVVSPEDMVGYAEHAKGSNTTKIFEDAYKSPLSIVILVRPGPQQKTCGRGASGPPAE